MKSKVLFGAFLMAAHDSKHGIRKIIKSFLYSSFKSILAIKGKPKAELLFELLLPDGIESFIDN